MEVVGKMNDKVDFKVFVWVMAIVLSCLGGLFGMYMSVKSELTAYNSKMSTDIGTIQGDVKSIKTDISWIKSAITTNED